MLGTPNQQSVLNGRVTGAFGSVGSVYIPTKDFTNLTGVYVGYFDWGPCNTPILITSSKDLEDNFGVITEKCADDYKTVLNYISYGFYMYVIRVIDPVKPLASVVYSRGNRNSFLGIYNNTTTGTITDVAIGEAIINQDDYRSKRIASLFPAFLTNESLRFYAKYPSIYGNTIKVAVCNYTDFLTAYVYGTVKFVDIFDSYLSSTEIAIVVLDNNNKILEQYIVSTVPGTKNSNGENYFIDDFIFRYSNYIYTVTNTTEIALNSVDTTSATNLVSGDSTALGGFYDYYNLDDKVFNYDTDFSTYLKFVDDTPSNILIDSFQSSGRCVKLKYTADGGVTYTNFLAQRAYRICSEASDVDSNKPAYYLYHFKFNNGDNIAATVAALKVLDTQLYFRDGTDYYDSCYIRACIVDTANNYNVIIVESTKEFLAADQIYLDSTHLVSVVFSDIYYVHDDSNEIYDRVNIHSDCFEYLDDSYMSGVFTSPNIYTVLSKDTVTDYAIRLLARGTYNKNCTFYFECQNDVLSIEIDGSYTYALSSAGDIAGAWSIYDFYVENRNAVSYDIVPFLNLSDYIKELNKYGVNIIGSVPLTMIDEDSSNNNSKYSLVRAYINKMKTDIDQIMQNNLFGKIIGKDLDSLNSDLISYKTDTVGMDEVVSSFRFDMQVDELNNWVKILIWATFNDWIGTIQFDVKRNLT